MPSSQKSKPARKKHAPRSRRVPRKLKHISPADFADSKAIIEVCEQPSPLTSTNALDLDSGLWGQARTQWMLGDWDSLASLELNQLEQVPQRAELAALSACARLQKGNKQGGRRHLAAASRWKCSPVFILRALVASSEANIGRYHEICGRVDQCTRLLASSAGTFGGDGKLASIYRIAANQRTRDQGTSVSAMERQPSSEAPIGPPSPSRRFAYSIEQAVHIALHNKGLGYATGITSHAQNFEDVMLWRALNQVSHGNYIDIGAWDPTIDSVSLAFYNKQWRGVHVEPSASYAQKLRQERQGDIVIEALVSDKHGILPFREIADSGLSTCVSAVADAMHEQGFSSSLIKKPSLTLDDVIAASSFTEIHWMKIDVEGMEEQVLKGWRSQGPLPWIIVVESTVPRSQVETYSLWEHYLTSRGYEFAYFDGLSRFYVSPVHLHLKPILCVPPNTFDAFTRPQH